MKIYVEGSPLFSRPSGVGHYIKRLLDQVARQNKANSFTIFGFLVLGKPKPPQALEPAENMHYRYIRYLPGKAYYWLLMHFWTLPIDILLGTKPDIIIFPNFVRWPIAFGEPTIAIVYDLSFELRPQDSDPVSRDFYRRQVPKTVNQANHIITISKNSKRELIEHYKVSAEKVSIVYPAVDHDFFRPTTEVEIDNIKQKYQLRKRYILYTGTLEPRKNIVGILDAYAGLNPSLQASHQLVLAGGKGWLDESIRHRLNELKLLNIITTGYVPTEDLPALYSGASVFVFPSNYEGFGMPPLEAMACGVPVIVTNNSSLPEVVGNAGIVVPTGDVAELSKQITSVLTDTKLARKLQSAGLKQAQKFSWDQSAEQFATILNRFGPKHG